MAYKLTVAHDGRTHIIRNSDFSQIVQRLFMAVCAAVPNSVSIAFNDGIDEWSVSVAKNGLICYSGPWAQLNRLLPTIDAVLEEMELETTSCTISRKGE